MTGWAWALALVALGSLALGIWIGRSGPVPRRRGQAPPADASRGMSYLISQEVDRAIETFTRVAGSDPMAVDVHMVLGNLHREKGQVERAIQIHKQLLGRADLEAPERTLVLLCLAEDYKKGGFIDRSGAMFHEVLEIDPGNREALAGLEKLYSGMRDWPRAYDAAKKLHALEGGHDERVLAFLRNQMGEVALKEGNLRGAQEAFEQALAHDPHSVPAALNLGAVFLQQRKFKRAKAIFEEVIERDPRRLSMVWRRLVQACRGLGEEGRVEELCRRQMAADPEDWRARLVLGELAEEARDLDQAAAWYSEALRLNPQAFSLHHRLLSVLARTKADPERLRDYLDLCEETMVVADRYVCVRCHYRAGELLWRCPSCQAWDPFVEEQG